MHKLWLSGVYQGVGVWRDYGRTGVKNISIIILRRGCHLGRGYKKWGNLSPPIGVEKEKRGTMHSLSTSETIRL